MPAAIFHAPAQRAPARNAVVARGADFFFALGSAHSWDSFADAIGAWLNCSART